MPDAGATVPPARAWSRRSMDGTDRKREHDEPWPASFSQPWEARRLNSPAALTPTGRPVWRRVGPGPLEHERRRAAAALLCIMRSSSSRELQRQHRANWCAGEALWRCRWR